jgi:hypothetical protein
VKIAGISGQLIEMNVVIPINLQNFTIGKSVVGSSFFIIFCERKVNALDSDLWMMKFVDFVKNF